MTEQRGDSWRYYIVGEKNMSEKETVAQRQRMISSFQTGDDDEIFSRLVVLPCFGRLVACSKNDTVKSTLVELKNNIFLYKLLHLEI